MPASAPTATADLVVVGAGICGNACAASAAGRGASVIVVEKEREPGLEASGRAQGILRLQGRAPAEIPLALEALDRWREAQDEGDFELVLAGHLYLSQNEAEAASLERIVADAHAAGLREVELLTPGEARRIIPAAEGPFLAATWSPADGHCQPDKATRLFVERATRGGVRHMFGTCVRAVLADGSRVTGVATDDAWIACDRVILAAGVWTPYLVAQLGMRLPIMPVALSEAETTDLPALFEQSIRAFAFGGRQRPNGRIVFSAGLGAAVEHYLRLGSARDLRTWLPRYRANRRDIKLRLDGRAIVRELHHRTATGSSLVAAGAAPPRPNMRILAAAFRAMQTVIPATRDARIERAWAGLVDMSPDSLPIVDAAEGPEGLVLVAGLSGHGLALAPVLGEIGADLALTGRTSRDIAAFRLSRFREEGVSQPERVM